MKMNKQRMRQKVINLMNEQKEADALEKSRIISDEFFSLPAFWKAKRILFYASCRGEVDTFFLIKKSLELQKCVALPKILKDKKQIVAVMISSIEDLRPGVYGIPEPDFAQERVMDITGLDLVVVPGLVFDKACRRLGRGYGYYDRFLSRLPLATPVVGLAYDFQVVREIPGIEAHDQSVTQVLHN